MDQPTRKIQGQIIASTTLDSQGEKISKENLKELFKQMPSSSVINQEHDLTLPPVAQIYNKQFVKIDSSEYAIKADVDIWDEEAFAASGGFSISYVIKTTKTGPKESGDIRIFFNGLQISSEEINSLLISDDAVQFDALEMRQKSAILVAVTGATLTITVFIGLSIAGGFFKSMGGDLYSKFKNKLRSLIEAKKLINERLTLNLVSPIVYNDHSFEVSILLGPDYADRLDDKDETLASVKNYLISNINNPRARRVVVIPQPDAPYWTIRNIIEADNLPTLSS